MAKTKVDKRSGFKKWITNAKLWWIFTILNLIGAISTSIAISSFSETRLLPSFFFSMIVFFLIEFTALYQGTGKIPHNWKWNIEVWGHCEKAYSSGICFLFPWFGIISYVEVFMGEQPLQLFKDERADSRGDIEFRGASAFADVTVFYQIEDSIKAAYNVSDLEAVLEEKLDSKVRSFLALFTIEEAIKLKAKSNLLYILNGDNSIKDVADHIVIPPPTKKEIKKNPFRKEIFNEWGVGINDIALADIELSGELKTARENVTVAERKAEQAVQEKKKRIIEAQATKKALDLEGDGYAKQVSYLEKQGLSPQEAVSYLQTRMKWENVGNKGATVILDSDNGDSLASIGTKIGAGMKAIPGTTTT